MGIAKDRIGLKYTGSSWGDFTTKFLFISLFRKSIDIYIACLKIDIS